MEVRFRQRPSSARCYRGDSEDVTKLCHHCSRAICRNHASGSERTEKRSLVVADAALRSSREFAGLKDLPVQSDSMVTHCGDCLHSLRRYRVYLYFALLIALAAAVGLAISIWKEQGSRILMAAAVVTGVALVDLCLAAYLYVRNYVKQRAPFPLPARFAPLEVEEVWSGSLHLDDKRACEVTASSTSGSLTVRQELTRDDRERLRSYRRKYLVPRRTPIPFHAGFLMLKGTPSIRFDNPAIVHTNIIALRGMVSKYPFLTSREGLETSIGEYHFDYEILPDEPRASRLPVQIVPFIPPNGGGRVLELNVSSWPPGRASSYSDTLCIEKLTVWVSHNGLLGSVVDMNPRGPVNSTSGELCWEHIPLMKTTWKDYDDELGETERTVYERKLEVRFENEISPETVLSGRLSLSGEGVFSGVNEIACFYPWGQRREAAEVRRKALIKLEFELSLAGLLFLKECSKKNSKPYVGAIPDHERMSTVAESITNAGMYLKRMVESRAQTSNVSAQITNRFWDLAGRNYKGLYPIDFHLTIGGEEARDGIAHSKVQVDIVVRATAPNNEMELQVNDVCETLSAILDETLGKPPVAQRTSPAGEVVRADGDEVASILALQRKLDEAYLDKRISEERYEEMQRRYRSELQRLGFTSH